MAPTKTKTPAKKATAKKATPAKSKTTAPAKDTGARAEARKRKEEEQAKVRQSRIDSGDLVITKTHEFEIATRVTDSARKTAKVIELLKASKDPLVYSDVAKKAGIKYPEDHVVAMHALENLGQVKRFDAKPLNGKSGRRSVAYLWVG